MADGRSELALQLTDAVAAAYQAIERAGNRAYKSFGLSQRAHAAMAAVDLGGPDGARPSDVASELRVSRAAATTFIQRLEAKGMVETTTDPDADRGVRVTLTRHGLEVLLRVGQLERRLAARKVAARSDSPIVVLLDLQGPRIRVGDLPAPRELKPGQEVVFAPEEVARADELPTTYDGLANDARVGSRILLNDGLLSVDVTAVEPPRVRGRVIDGGILTAHKGMNLPGVQVSAPALTEKDREDVTDALKIGVDYLALSFVRRPEDIEELRGLVRGASTKLVAKIEKATALDNLDKIVAVSDAVMVARGDLGVELPFEQVPLVQKRLIAEANHQGRP